MFLLGVVASIMSATSDRRARDRFSAVVTPLGDPAAPLPFARPDEVVLVALDGSVEGAVAKLDAHRPPGRLHLAFSVLVFNAFGETLVQRRAESKYHFAGHWANACCSHPRPGEGVDAAALRRLREELGLCCDLVDVGTFVYRATCPTGGLVEHELDHVLVGTLDADARVRPDPDEVAEWRWVRTDALLGGAPGLPGPLAPWLAPALMLAVRARSQAGVPGGAAALRI